MTKGLGITHLREEAGLTIRALAFEMGIPHTTLYSQENLSKDRYISRDWAERLIPVLSKHGIEPKRVLALAGLADSSLVTDLITGVITSDQAITESKSNTLVPIPLNIQAPSEIEVYRIGDDSMADMGLIMGATIFARPVWLGGASFGSGSTVILKQARADGIITASVRFLHAEPGGPFMASARSANPAYQPKLVPDDANYHSATDDPAHGGSPSIYAVVEQAELDLKS